MSAMLQFLRTSLSSIAAILVVGTFFAVLGPYQTHQLGMPGVWFYWTGLMALGWAAGALAGAAFERWTPPWPVWLTYLIVSLIVSVPVTMAVVIIQTFLGRPFPVDQIPLVFVLVWVISIGVTLVSWLRNRPEEAVAAQSAEPAAGRALIDKLPHRLRQADLLALESEDHYLRVHTSSGDALILMRLTDAIAAVESLDGSRTHRSWWVARTAVTGVARGDGRATLTLSNGVEAPVSRTYAPKLRDAGWY